MNKTKLTVLAGALLFALGGSAVAGEGQQSTAPNPQATTQSDTSVQSSTHGDVVGGVAQQQQGEDSMAPPDSPPGATVSQVAQSQGNWMQLDTDADGSLSDAEIQADAELAAVVDTYDTDADGSLTRAEFDAYVEATATDTLTAGEDTEFEADVDFE